MDNILKQQKNTIYSVIFLGREFFSPQSTEFNSLPLQRY